jgi:hypothetical protein
MDCSRFTKYTNIINIIKTLYFWECKIILFFLSQIKMRVENIYLLFQNLIILNNGGKDHLLVVFKDLILTLR